MQCKIIISNSKQVVKVILQKALSPLHTDGSIVFARWRQRAPDACFLELIRSIKSTTQTASGSVQPFFAELTIVTDRPTDRPTDTQR